MALSDLSDKRVDHLILLVGGNPLPNAVAAMLLVKPTGVLSLIHSDKTCDTSTRLKTWIKNRPGLAGLDIRPRQVPEADPSAIQQIIEDQLGKVDRSSTGLNYTGGTKAMTVHAYLAVKRWASSRRVTPQFSYLDARQLRMVFDPRSPETGEASSSEPLNQPDADDKFPVELSLKDLLALHDWQHGSSSDKPILPDAAEALLRVCCDVDAAEQWASWKREKLDPLKDRQSRTGWKDDSILRNVCLDLPSAQNLETAVEVLLIALKLPAKTDCIPLGKAALNAGFVLISDLCQWLDGGWLESAVLQRLICLRKMHHLQSPLINVIPKKGGTRFEVDVVATRGYQLFAVSCSTDVGHFLLKHKLFEATVRARQIGGDEARIALVCCSDHPEWVQAEMRRDLDPHVTVFGREHLLELCKKLSDWMSEPTGAGV